MRSVAIVGLGNIGSAAVPLVARMPDVTRITLVDPDAYTEQNLASQAIDCAAIGRAKVDVQAEAIGRIAPDIAVETIGARIEDVPLGLLRNSTLVACVDNRRARQTVNRIARRCGSAWIDAAVGAPSLVRVAVYGAGESAPCLECAWDDDAYALLEQEYPCQAGRAAVPATEAPAELGALAASLQALELRKLLGDDGSDAMPAGAQLMLDTSTYARHLTVLPRNAQCRFDHAVWTDIDSLALDPRTHTLAELFAAARANADAVLGVEGQRFATHVDCVICGTRTSVGLALYRRLGRDTRTCACGGTMLAAGFFSYETIKRSELSRTLGALSLETLGLRLGDVVSVGSASGSVRHLEIAAGAKP